MTSVFGLVRAYILGDTAVAAAIGTRLYPVKAPQNPTYPLVTMQKIVEPRYPHLRGSGGLAAPRYQIDVWVKELAGTATFNRAIEIAELIRRRIDGYSGVLTTSGSPSDAFQVSILYDDSRDLFEVDQALGGFYRQSTDYVIWTRPVTS